MKSVKPLWQSVRVRDVPGGEKQTKRENSRQTNMFVNNRKEKILQDGTNPPRVVLGRPQAPIVLMFGPPCGGFMIDFEI